MFTKEASWQRNSMEVYHHGYFLTGDREKAMDRALEMAAEILEIKKEALNSHPDFSLLETDNFAIGDARRVKENSAKKSFFGRGRIFVIKSNLFTREACNALLKTFEEPAGASYFFVVTASPENILETLRSRLTVLRFEEDKKLSKEKKDFIEKFFKSDSDKRLKLTEKFLKDKEKAKEKTSEFLDELEVVLRDTMAGKQEARMVEAVDELLKQRAYLLQRASSPKIILEYICLTFPKF
ncbi:hypothetical protein KKB69_02395 [Patescibacteria group bacterium]|nr:hypothetical protein [Patescibacteria group bacterium]